MNPYSNKQLFKIFLFISAISIVAGSLWYTSTIVNKIRKEEREKVKVWSAAVKKKAKLVFITNQLFSQLELEEQKKAKLWAEATRKLINGASEDLTFYLDIVSANNTVPVVIMDNQGKPTTTRNLEIENKRDEIRAKIEALKPGLSPDAYNDLQQQAVEDTIQQYVENWKKNKPPIEIDITPEKRHFLYYTDSKLIQELKNKRDSLITSFNHELVDNSVSVPVIFVNDKRDSVFASSIKGIDQLADSQLYTLLYQMEAQNHPIEVNLDNVQSGYIFYSDSNVLVQLKYYPYIQFGIIGLFLLVAYFIFSSYRKAEQDLVWVGLAKETAHQLGTPLSSLIAWIELLKEMGIGESTLVEMRKDIDRLNLIAERFSKIGSVTKLTSQDVVEITSYVTGYLKNRVSKKIVFKISSENNTPVMAQINRPLFEWVIENLCKNAVDAMAGGGQITINIKEKDKTAVVDVTDTGKGIPGSKFKTVFKPGYTTKKRGWGLGLSLVKRIIVSYHRGKIFVKNSAPTTGTTFRIILKK